MEITYRRLLVILLVFLLPWQARYFFLQARLGGVYWEQGSVYLYVWQALVWVALIAHWRDIKHFCNSRYAFFCAAVLVLSLLPIVHARFPLLVLFYWVHIVEALAIYALLASRDAREKDLLRQFFIMAGIVQALVGLWQFFVQYSPASTLMGMSEHDPRQLGVAVIEYGLERWLRAYGTLSHPNILGGFIAVAMLFAAAHYVRGWTEYVRSGMRRAGVGNPAYALGAWALLSLGLIASFSKSAWLAICVALAVLFFTTKQRWAVGKLAIVLALIFGFAVVSQPHLIGIRVLGHGRLETQSYEERKVSIIAGYYVIKDNIWLGYGLGNYTYALSKKFRWIPYYYQPIHNAFMALWSEVGIAGALCALFFVAARVMRKSPLIILLAVIALFDHYLVSSPFGFYLIAVSAGLWATNDTLDRWAVMPKG